MSSPLISPISNRAVPSPPRQGSPSPPASPASSSSPSSSPSPPSSPSPVAVSELALETVVPVPDASPESPVVTASDPDQASVDAVAAGGETARPCAVEETESVVVPSGDTSLVTEQSSLAPVSGPDEVEERPMGLTDSGVVSTGEPYVPASPQPSLDIAPAPLALGSQSLPTIVEEGEVEVALPSLPDATGTEDSTTDVEMVSAEPVSATPIVDVSPVAEVSVIVLSPPEEPSMAVSEEMMTGTDQEPMCDDEEMGEPEPELAATQDESMDDVEQIHEIVTQPAPVSTYFGQNSGSQPGLNFNFALAHRAPNPQLTLSSSSGPSSFVPVSEEFSFHRENPRQPVFFSQMPVSMSTPESAMPRADTMSQEMEVEPARATIIDDGAMGSGSSPSHGEPSADVDMANISNQTSEHVGSSSHGESSVDVDMENINVRNGGDGYDPELAELEEALDEEIMDEQARLAEEQAARARAEIRDNIERSIVQVAAAREVDRQTPGGGNAPSSNVEVESDQPMSGSSVSEEDGKGKSVPSPDSEPQAQRPEASLSSDESEDGIEFVDVPIPSLSQVNDTTPEQVPEHATPMKFDPPPTPSNLEFDLPPRKKSIEIIFDDWPHKVPRPDAPPVDTARLALTMAEMDENAEVARALAAAQEEAIAEERRRAEEEKRRVEEEAARLKAEEEAEKKRQWEEGRQARSDAAYQAYLKRQKKPVNIFFQPKRKPGPRPPPPPPPPPPPAAGGSSDAVMSG
ncbi:hypothetical protein F4810DRAFT_37775 [Camillea tinctor]|nr:hypothetical protein F4810DRAFT_37775 [Camillea tinctor]